MPGERHWARALRSARLVRLLVGVLFVGLAIGAFTVAITAHAEEVASRSAAAWLIAANAVGALIGGVVNTMVRPAVDPSRRVFWLAALLTAGYAPLVAAPGLVGTVPFAVVSGLALPPTLACVFVLVGAATPAGTATEAFAWVVTGFGAGTRQVPRSPVPSWTPRVTGRRSRCAVGCCRHPDGWSITVGAGRDVIIRGRNAPGE